MDYFEALKRSADEPTGDAEEQSITLPEPPSMTSASDILGFIKKVCDGLYFSSDSDEPVELYQLSPASLQALESGADKLSLPSAKDFAELVAAGSLTQQSDGVEFVAERRPVGEFFQRLCGQQVSEQQKQLAGALSDVFERTRGVAGAEVAYYRVGVAPSIEVYVVMLVDGQVVGIKTLSVET
ncbi:hypothetical protein GGI07_003024 [Coemansia sp. Benny D115]|nr:hypothetical protein GGI07_003024 [Coemansia sp. Benny D115]